MKIAIPSKGKDLGSDIDPRFGRTEFFIIFDSADGSFNVIDNSQNINAAQGAGIQAAQNVANENVSLVISSNLGPKAFETLKAAGIKIALCSEGTVRDALELVKNGKIKYTDGANVEGHW